MIVTECDTGMDRPKDDSTIDLQRLVLLARFQTGL